MKKWVISAIAYMIVVIGGYYVYAEFIKGETDDDVASSVENHQESNKEHSHDENQVDDALGNLKANVEYTDSTLEINLEDQAGKPFHDLEVNHEKIMHLIVVDSHMETYYHLHPEKVGDGAFEVKQPLTDGEYKAFVDIKPNNQIYEVSPILFTVGKANHGHEGDLIVDQSLEKTVDNQTVQLSLSTREPMKPVQLTFDVDRANLEPYLGAMGHVVILDEHAENFLHVHPASETETTFETKFEQPGIYKIWAEFKQNGKVRVFPFVVEIK